MDKIKIDIPIGLEKDIQDYGNEIAKNIAIRAREELTECYKKSIMEDFYEKYMPIKYKRTWQLKKSYVKFYRNSHGNIFYGGVKITDEKMEETHDIPNVQIIDLALKGIHGHPLRGIYTKPEPFNVVMDYRDEIFNNIQSWGTEAIELSKTTRSYSMLF